MTNDVTEEMLSANLNALSRVCRKNDNGQTSLFAASYFEEISDIQAKNLEKLYRIGRFEAGH